MLGFFDVIWRRLRQPNTALGLQRDTNDAGVSLQNVSVCYNGATVLEDFNLNVAPGETVCLLGPSGSGKTTVLRAVAGFVRPSRGRILVGDTDVTQMPPYARNIGVVVQQYALFPHMDVANNVAFGLQARGVPKKPMRERVRACLAMVGMEAYHDRYPDQLSGGQQQRVALARALAIAPKLLLLDEPLSALDKQSRRAMIEQLTGLRRELPRLSMLYVTHEPKEALALADRLAILRDGRLAAQGETRSLYRNPPSQFCAEFLGHANVISGALVSLDAGTGLAELAIGELRVRGRLPFKLELGSPAVLCVQPENMTLRPRNHAASRLDGIVQFCTWQGHRHSISVRHSDCEWRVAIPACATPPRPGDLLSAFFSPEDATVFACEARHVTPRH